MDRRKKFLTIRVVRHWHRLPRDVVVALSLQMPKVMLDGALSTDGAVSVPAHCREWEEMAFKSPLQSKPFCDSMNFSIGFV